MNAKMIFVLLGVVNQMEFNDAITGICMAIDDLSKKYGVEREEIFQTIAELVRDVNQIAGEIESPYGNSVNVTIVDKTDQGKGGA